MKHSVIIYVALLACGLLYAADDNSIATPLITHYEYWLNGDYENRTAENITPTEVLHIEQLIDAAALPNGINTLALRFCDEKGVWSSTESMYFHKGLDHSVNKLIAYEHWFNEDYESRVKESITPTEVIRINQLIDAVALPNGFNTLTLRFCNEKGVWSNTESMYFYKGLDHSVNKLIAYKYWFNENYESHVNENITPTEMIRINQLIDAAALPNGFNTLTLRFCNEKGVWSNTESMYFYKGADNSIDKIVAYEYWLDTCFNEVKQVILPEPITHLVLNDVLDFSQVNKGARELHLRFQSERGVWSGVLSDSIQIYNTVDIIESSFNNLATLYPNPTSGSFKIDLGKEYDDVEIRILTINGQLVRTIQATNTQIIDVDMQEPIGTYLIYIKSGNNTATLRLIKRY